MLKREEGERLGVQEGERTQKTCGGSLFCLEVEHNSSGHNEIRSNTSWCLPLF